MQEQDKKYIEKMISKYDAKQTNKLTELKVLDKKAKKVANLFAYIFGIIGSLVLGIGMCVAMQVIFAEHMYLGIIIGMVGILMVIINYFIYQKLLVKGKNKYASQILELSNELLNK